MTYWKNSEIGNIPFEWPTSKFKDVLKIKGRIGWKGYKTNDLRPSGPVVIGGVNIKSNLHIDYSSLSHLSREKFEESPEIMLKKGDVILVTRGNGIGAVGWYDGKFEEATINPSVVIFSDFKGDSKFLFYFLLSPQGAEQIMSLEGGSSIPALYQGLLKNLLLPLPPLPEQRAIADVLSSLDDKIDLLHRQNATLEAMAEALFKQWFVVEAREEWETVKVGRFVKTNQRTVTKDYPFREIEYLDTSSLNKGMVTSIQNIELVNAPSRAKRLVQNNDILISTVRPDQKHYGIIRKPSERLVVSTGFCVITCIDIDPHFIYLLLTTEDMTEYLHSIAEGSTSTYPSLKPHDIEEIEFALPPKALISRFGELASSYWDKIHSNQIQIRTLTALRDTLLPKLMSGEVRVKM